MKKKKNDICYHKDYMGDVTLSRLTNTDRWICCECGELFTIAKIQGAIDRDSRSTAIEHLRVLDIDVSRRTSLEELNELYQKHMEEDSIKNKIIRD